MAPTSSWTHPFKSYLTSHFRSSIGCIFRALVHCESGLEYCLRNLPPPFVAEFRAHNSRGRAAEEQGDWKTAEDSFVQCRNLIMIMVSLREGSEDRLGSVVRQSLVAWANLFLAQLYQSLGTQDTIKWAMELRKQILDCVRPLHSSGAVPQLVKVCEIYYYTARYEVGDALGSSKEKDGAIQSYSEVMSCSEDAAEAQICFLLCSDHMCLGRFKESLRWIREANRVRKKQSADWNGCKGFFLEYEAALLMKLERFSEAVEALKDLSQTSDYGHRQMFAQRVHTMFRQCYTEMSRRAADDQDVPRAEEYKDLAREQISLIQSLQEKGVHPCQDQFPNTAFTHPLMMPITSPLGIWTAPLRKESLEDQSSLKGGLAMGFSQRLGLTQANNWSVPHLRKIPTGIASVLLRQIDVQKEARKQHDWKTAIFQSEQMRELLKLAKGCVDTETHGWLLAMVDLPLANLYHFHARMFAKALTIWKEIQECAVVHIDASSRTSLKDYHIPFVALEYELSCSSTSKYEIIQKWARACCTDEKTGERDLCFWLYFGYRLHENFEEALKWLLEAKRLREDHDGCLRKRGPIIDYFCCDYDYNRCEVELFTKLGMHEKAINALESLLNTKHVQQDGLINVDFEQVDESVEAQLPAETPTATGCIAIKQSNPSNLTLVNDLQIVQSSVGLEHHLLKLPFPFQLALRKHSYLGRLYDVEQADWENAIFQYEWCQELLNTVILLNREFHDVFNWLMTWIAVPLANLYEYRTKNNYKKALDLRMQMVNWIAAFDQRSLQANIQYDVYVAAYLCAILDYPDDTDVKNQVVASAVAMLVEKDEWRVEYDLMCRIITDFVTVYENYEGGLLFIRQAMQLVEQRFQEPACKLTEEYASFVFAEVTCLRRLRRPDEVKTVLENYWSMSDKSGLRSQPKLVQRILDSREDLQNGDFRELNLYTYKELSELKQKSRECLEKQEYAKAISYHEDFLKLIEENPKPEGPEHQQDLRLTFAVNAWIATMYLDMFADAVWHPTQPMKAEFGKDGNFLRAVEYYKKCLHQLTSADEIFHKLRSDLVASILLHLMTVYFLAWSQCRTYLKSYEFTLRKKLKLWDEYNYSWQVIDAYRDEIERCLEFAQQLPVQEYGQRLIMQHTRSLHTVSSKQYTEGWIEWLEDYKSVYSFLQQYHATRGSWIRLWIKLNVNPESDINPEAFKIFNESEADVSWWNAFLYAERERTRVMLYQHEIHRRNSLGFPIQQWGFDTHDSSALRYIKESCRALLTRESCVFVQYSPTTIVTLTPKASTYSIYVLVIDPDHGCELFVEQTLSFYFDESIDKLIGDENLDNLTGDEKEKFQSMREKRLKNLYDYLAYKTDHPNHKEICQDKEYRRLRKSSITDDESMNKYLEFLYDMLIGPIAHHLDKMKRGDKLVLAPCELLTQVPFAALRNRKDQKRLIESHAMAMAPSLRVLQMCSERAQALQSRSGHGPGSILALGDPTYDCKKCKKKKRKRLEATAKEVDHIASLFPEAEMVTLTGKNATAKQLLECASKLSQESSSRLAVVHIGAHGVIDKEKNYRNSHLQLACDPSLSSANSATTSASDHQTSEVIMSFSRGKPDDEQSDEDASDSEIEDDATIGRSMFSRIMGSRFITNTVATSGDIDGASSRGGEVRLKRNGGACALAHDLTVEGIQSLERRWSAELLVLSACQTSAGRTTTEGVLSLARAFMAMGVPCVVASLWKVDDEATFALMKDFYDELRAGNDVACALQSATLRSMARHGPNAVQYWAPFNVWGVPSLRIPKGLQHQESPPSDCSSSHGKSKG